MAPGCEAAAFQGVKHFSAVTPGLAQVSGCRRGRIKGRQSRQQASRRWVVPKGCDDQRRRCVLKKLLLAAFTAVSLTAALAPLASAGTPSGAYDNTANSLGGRPAGNYGGA